MSTTRRISLLLVAVVTVSAVAGMFVVGGVRDLNAGGEPNP